jgi:hypothetical protein
VRTVASYVTTIARENSPLSSADHTHNLAVSSDEPRCRPHRLRRLVLYSAFVPEKGAPLLDDVPPGHAALFQAAR